MKSFFSSDPLSFFYTHNRPGSHTINTINKRLVRVKDQEGRSIGTEIVPIQGVENCGIDWDKDETIEWKTAECSTGGKEKRFNPLLFLALSLSPSSKTVNGNRNRQKRLID